MATYKGTFTLKGTDLGNLVSYQYFYDDTYTPNTGALGTTFDEIMTNICNDMTVSMVASSITYSNNGPGTWNAGTDTIVTITIVNPQFEPYFAYIQTEDFYYPIHIKQFTTTTLCNECQFIQLTQCGADNFFLDLGLADGPYTAYYADNTSGVIWEQGTYSSTAQGGLSMYQWQATSGMFNEFSFYTLTIRDTNGDAVSWIVNGIEYNCATLTFKKTVNVTD